MSDVWNGMLAIWCSISDVVQFFLCWGPVSKSLAITVTNHMGPKELHWRQKNLSLQYVEYDDVSQSHHTHFTDDEWQDDLIDQSQILSTMRQPIITMITDWLKHTTWGTPYDGLYREVALKRGIFFRLKVYERVGISLVEVYKRVVKSFFWVCKRAQITDGSYGFKKVLFLSLIPI